MKQFLTSLAVFVLLFSAQAQPAQQTSFKPVTEADLAISRITILPKVAVNFHHAYPDATNASWSKDKTGYFVRFSVGEIGYSVFLNKKGKCIGEIKDYKEKLLPDDVRRLVKTNYDRYTIKFVKEVQAKGVTAYLVTIEDATTWKTIRVIDGEMDVREEFRKF